MAAVPKISKDARVLQNNCHKAGELEEEELTRLGKTKYFVKRLSLIVPDNLYVLLFIWFVSQEVNPVSFISEDLGKPQRRDRNNLTSLGPSQACNTAPRRMEALGVGRHFHMC